MPIIFVADDLGMRADINNAILHAHKSGILHAAALMMAQPATHEAVTMARANPDLQIGWHLHLADSVPSTVSKWPWGSSPTQAGLSMALSRRSRKLMREEIARQWDLFQETGLPCAFVNSHHHLHAHPAVFEALIEKVGTDFKGWIRLGETRFFGSGPEFFESARIIDLLFRRARRLSTLQTSDTLWGLDRLFAMNAWEVRGAIATLPEGFHEFLFHPRDLSCPDTQCLLELKTLLSR
jgi:predicted glycoside hydrolase/deacetylase ChbG (UPF0249 family)